MVVIQICQTMRLLWRLISKLAKCSSGSLYYYYYFHWWVGVYEVKSMNFNPLFVAESGRQWHFSFFDALLHKLLSIPGFRGKSDKSGYEMTARKSTGGSPYTARIHSPGAFSFSKHSTLTDFSNCFFFELGCGIMNIKFLLQPLKAFSHFIRTIIH